jgi:hypothetical protein
MDDVAKGFRIDPNNIVDLSVQARGARSQTMTTLPSALHR